MAEKTVTIPKRAMDFIIHNQRALIIKGEVIDAITGNEVLRAPRPDDKVRYTFHDRSTRILTSDHVKALQSVSYEIRWASRVWAPSELMDDHNGYYNA